jgi:hypothetical protein
MRRTLMLLQLPFPPSPIIPIHPPGKIELLFVCILATLLWFELIVFLLPEPWREKIGELQFGSAWAKKRQDSRD